MSVLVHDTEIHTHTHTTLTECREFLFVAFYTHVSYRIKCTFVWSENNRNSDIWFLVDSIYAFMLRTLAPTAYVVGQGIVYLINDPKVAMHAIKGTHAWYDIQHSLFLILGMGVWCVYGVCALVHAFKPKNNMRMRKYNSIERVCVYSTIYAMMGMVWWWQKQAHEFN